MGFIVGGGAAAAIQSGSAITRLLSSQFTAGTGNPVVSTTEGVAATGFSILSLVIPIFVAIIILVFIVIILRTLYKRFLRKREA